MKFKSNLKNNPPVNSITYVSKKEDIYLLNGDSAYGFHLGARKGINYDQVSIEKFVYYPDEQKALIEYERSGSTIETNVDGYEFNSSYSYFKRVKMDVTAEEMEKLLSGDEIVGRKLGERAKDADYYSVNPFTKAIKSIFGKNKAVAKKVDKEADKEISDEEREI